MDHDRGLIVGEDSWGKGLVQTVFPLAPNMAVALTVAKYLTPSGRSIQRDYSHLDDYLMSKRAPDDSREVRYTEHGRKVLGQGGITPDYAVDSLLKPFTGRLRLSGAFFTYARRLVLHQTDLGRKFVFPQDPKDAGAAAAGKIQVGTAFVVDDEVVADFRKFLSLPQDRVRREGFHRRRNGDPPGARAGDRRRRLGRRRGRPGGAHDRSHRQQGDRGHARSGQAPREMKIALASDHAGYALKTGVADYLRGRGLPFEDLGCDSGEAVDYVDYGARGARAVLSGACDRAILICGTGLGMAIVANKFKGIRATPCWNEYTAEMSRKHNDANCLTMGGRTHTLEQALAIVRVWLATDFEDGRHGRRVRMVRDLEDENFK